MYKFDELLKKYKFINLEKDEIFNIINEFSQEKNINEIHKVFYFELMENLI